MAAKKPTTPTDEKLEKQDFDLFEALSALDRKDYDYYDNLSPEQQKKFVPYMMLIWMSAIKGTANLQRYYPIAVNEYANKHYFSDYIQKHPKLQWLMLCSASPGSGKQFHQWIPSLKDDVTRLREVAKLKDIKDYYTKIYPKAGPEDIQQVSTMFVAEHKKKCYLAKRFPYMKRDDIEVLTTMVSDQDIENYEKDLGN
jgi:hypothetical protein